MLGDEKEEEEGEEEEGSGRGTGAPGGRSVEVTAVEGT